MPIKGLEQSRNCGLPEVLLDFGFEPPGFDEARYPIVWYKSRHKTETGQPAVLIHASGDQNASQEDVSYCLRYEDGTRVFVGPGATRIWVTWPPNSSLEGSCTYVLGPVMAIVAQLRGTTCLHGSAVVIDGGIAAFLGPPGAGKSTTAAAFARAGFTVASDDLILLAEAAHGFVVEPSYPVLRLWPSTVELLFGHEDALPRLCPEWEKRSLNLTQSKYRFQREPLPLRAIYVLGERSAAQPAPFLCPLSGAAALLKLVSNSWAHYADKPSLLAAQLQVLTSVSRQTPIRHLFAYQDVARIPDLIELVAADVRGMHDLTGNEAFPASPLTGTGTRDSRN